SRVTIPAGVGRQAGGNLFHSFGDFNVSRKQTVVFTGGPAGGGGPTSRVIARVTGGRPTGINGQLQNGIAGAQLFLISPLGVTVGRGASLDSPAGLVLSTVGLKFSDGTTFDDTTPINSTLSSAPPVAFGFLSPKAAASDIH